MCSKKLLILVITRNSVRLWLSEARGKLTLLTYRDNPHRIEQRQGCCLMIIQHHIDWPNVDLIQRGTRNSVAERKCKRADYLKRYAAFYLSVRWKIRTKGRKKQRKTGWEKKLWCVLIDSGITRVAVITKPGSYSILRSSKYAEPELCVINPGVIFASKHSEPGYDWKVNRLRGVMMRNIFSYWHDAREFILLFRRLCRHVKIARARDGVLNLPFSSKVLTRPGEPRWCRVSDFQKRRERILFLSLAFAFRSASVSRPKAKTTRRCA